MESVSMKKRFVMAKVVSIMLLLVAVQAQEFFPSDYSSSEATSLVLESEFPQYSEDTKFPLETLKFPSKPQSHSEETSLPLESAFFQEFEDTIFPLQTQRSPPQTQSHSEITSLSSESEFPQVSEDTNEPLKTQQLALEKESNSQYHLPPQSPAPAASTPETPLPAKPPSHPKRPWSPSNTCKTKCATNCMRNKVPFLHNLCNRVCREKCILYYLQMIYNCTNHCVESMPKNFKSDKKKVAGYVNYCYQKCIKKF